ncbi:MAG: GHKL domain-containing protein [Bacilli bacterium]
MLEVITNLINAILGTIILLYVVSFIYEGEIKLSYKSILGIVFSIISVYFNSKFSVGIDKMLLSLVIMVITICLIFNKSFKKAILPAFFMLLLLSLSEVLTFFILSLIIPDFSCVITDNSHLKILCNIIILLMAYMVININFIKNNVSNISKIKMTKSITFYVIIIITIIGISVLFINLSKNNLFYLNIIMVILFILLATSSINDKYNKNRIIDKYNQLFKYIRNYEQILEEHRLEKHEYRNQLITIKGMIDNKNKELNSYINNIIGDGKQIKELMINKLKNIPFGGLKGLLLYKISEIENNKIDISINVDKNIEDFNFNLLTSGDYKDLCTIIGVFLDNAKEATIECKDKKIGIEIFKENKNFNIIICNTFNNEIDINDIDKKGFSTKGEKRGYGLYIVKEKIKKNKKISLRREIINNYYVQKIIIKT